MTPAHALKPRKQPRQERARITVEAILEAAAQVFAEHGYAAGTTNRIAARAGVSIGSLYEYFPGKDAIVMELSRRHLDESGAIAWPALAQLVAHPPPLRQGLEAIVGGMIALHDRAARLQEVFFEHSPRSAEIEALRVAFFERACDAIADYLRACPEIVVADHDLAARLVAQTVDGVTHGLAIRSSADGSMQRYARETVTMLERYLTAQVDGFVRPQR